MIEYFEGQTIKIKAPFLKDKCDWLDVGYLWRHGFSLDGDPDDIYSYADDEGVAVFKIVKIVELQPPYTNRILFRKQLIDPDGNEGKPKPLEMLGVKAFNSLTTGKRWNYEII